MRASQRFRWLLPAIGIPVAITALGVAIQVAGFERPPRDSLVTAAALRELLRYRVMRGSEEIGGRRLASICVQGWFHAPLHRRPVRGALVLLGNGERLYDVGTGVRRLGRRGRASPLDRARFLLAGCPRVVGENVTARLVHGRPVDPDLQRMDGAPALSLLFGRANRRVDLFVASQTYRPLALSFDWPHVHGRSDLDPGAGRAAIVRVRHAFELDGNRSPGGA